MDIPLSLLFDYKTVAGLAAHLNDQELLVIPNAIGKSEQKNTQVNKMKL